MKIKVKKRFNFSWRKGNINACKNNFNAFTNQLEAICGLKLTEEQADVPIGDAQNIINKL